MSEVIDSFLAITGSSDSQVAESFLDMSGGDLETAISLFFEHGPSTATTSNTGNSSTQAQSFTPHTDDDASLAERLQNEAYQEQQNSQTDFRPPDEAVHERLVDDSPVHLFPGQYGGIGGLYGALLNNRRVDQTGEIYGNARAGIFNQRDTDDEYMQESSEGEEEERLQEVDSDDEPIVREETHEQRLARLFRPPFDIIEKLTLTSAKLKARQEHRWLLINIQDMSEFQCHQLNRDFWSSSSVKEVVRENFLFLQYHSDSRNGQEYSQFYSFDSFPHIAILDPITGERLKMWSGLPIVSEWLEEVEEFLDQFSLDKGKINPIVEHKKKVDPTTLSEEEQLEYAIKQSLGNKDHDDKDDVQIVKLDKQEEKPLTEEDIVKKIEPILHEEPIAGNSTRVQIRTSDGKRVVRKFSTDDKVLVIYQFVKANFEQLIENTAFTLTSQRDNLFSRIDQTIEEAGLKNASILLEVQS